MIITLIIVLLTINLLSSYLICSTFEAIYELRTCIKRNPSGGYYQKWTISEHLAARYLRKRYEITVDNLPQGGYNVYPYRRKTLSLPGDSYKDLDDGSTYT